MNKIKINIFSPGRFHVCDLARELDKNGFDVKFYWLNSTETDEIRWETNMGVAEIDDKGRVHCRGRGSFNIVGRGVKSGKVYISPNITIR